MKQSIILASAVAFLFVVSSCSKKSSNTSSATLGSVVFSYNGSSVKMVAVADTSAGELDLTAGGTLPGSKDTAVLDLTCGYYGPNYLSIAQYNGTWTDTTVSQSAWASFLDNTTGGVFNDINPATQYPSFATPFTIRINSNNGSVVTGTFTGHLYLQNGNQQDSVVLANGAFNVQL